jgi:ureidoglycolate lyase
MMLLARTPDAAAFSPFGSLIEAPQTAGERRVFSDWLAPVPGLGLQFHLNKVEPVALPATLTQVERHPHSAQVFLPIGVSRYLITVMPADPEGLPDAAAALCFLMPGNLGVVYRRNAWHAGITVLDRPGSFAVMMWRGASDDDVFCPIEPRTIDLPQLQQTGTSS